MSTTTPVFGWAIPQGTDLIAQIATIVSDGITDIENQANVPSNSKSVADAYSTYPLGVSLMALSGTGATNGAWPENFSSYVLTLRRQGGDAAAQFHITNRTSSPPSVRFRNGNANGWTDWQTVVGPGTPNAQASGQITLTDAMKDSNGNRTAVVTFPSGRFAAPPRVSLSLHQTSRPDQVVGSPADFNVTSTQFTVYVKRTDTIGQSVTWVAIQGVE